MRKFLALAFSLLCTPANAHNPDWEMWASFWAATTRPEWSINTVLAEPPPVSWMDNVRSYSVSVARGSQFGWPVVKQMQDWVHANHARFGLVWEMAIVNPLYNCTPGEGSELQIQATASLNNLLAAGVYPDYIEADFPSNNFESLCSNITPQRGMQQLAIGAQQIFATFPNMPRVLHYTISPQTFSHFLGFTNWIDYYKIIQDSCTAFSGVVCNTEFDTGYLQGPDAPYWVADMTAATAYNQTLCPKPVTAIFIDAGGNAASGPPLTYDVWSAQVMKNIQTLHDNPQIILNRVIAAAWQHVYMTNANWEDYIFRIRAATGN